MDSSNRRNTGLTAFVGDLGTELTPPQEFVSAMRTAIYGFPMKLYLTKAVDTENPTEDEKANREFLGIYNFNLDKGCTDSLGLVSADDLKDIIRDKTADPVLAEEECDRFDNEYPEWDCLSFEVAANSDISAGAFADYSYESVKSDFEIRYPDEDDIANTTHEGKFNEGSDTIEITKLTNEVNGIYSIDRTQTTLSNRRFTFTKSDYDMSESIYGEYTTTAYDELLVLTLNSDGSCTLAESGDQIKKRNYAHLQKLVKWVMSADKETFRRDFEKHFNWSATVDYFLTVLVCGMVDNLGKNMMIDTYGPISKAKYEANPDKYTYTEEELDEFDNYIWYPHFYDLDSDLGVDNSGYLRFDVDIEIEPGTFNTSKSILWTKFFDFFYDEIVERYEELRAYSTEHASYTEKSILEYLIDKGIATIPESIFNLSMKNKYLSNESKRGYLHMMHGSQQEHFRRWVSQRLYFLDTMFGIGADVNKTITIRVEYNDFASVPVTYNIQTYKPAYVEVIYSGIESNRQKLKIPRNVTRTFQGWVNTSTDSETKINNAPNIKTFGDVSRFTPKTVLISDAVKLAELIVGTDEYPNPNLASLVLGSNTYLTKIIARNCTGINNSLDVQGCTNLKELDVTGSSILYAEFNKNGGSLNTLKLSYATTTINLNNFALLENIEIQSLDKLTKVSIKNCPKLTGYKDENGNIVEGGIWANLLDKWLPSSATTSMDIEGYGILRSNKFLDNCVELHKLYGLTNRRINFSGEVRYLGSNIPENYSFYTDYFPTLNVRYPNVNNFSSMFQNYKNINAIYSREENVYDELTGITEKVIKYYWTDVREDEFDYSDLIFDSDGTARRPINIYDDSDLELVALEIRERLSPFEVFKNMDNMFEGCQYLGYLKDDTFDGKDLSEASTTNMFYNCNRLKYFEVPSDPFKGLRKLGDSMFYNCNNVKVFIPETVTSISDTAFYCDVLSAGLHPLLLFEASDVPYNTFQPDFIENLRDCRFNVKRGENGRALQHSDAVSIYDIYFRDGGEISSNKEKQVYLSYFDTKDRGIILYSVKSGNSTSDGEEISLNTFNIDGEGLSTGDTINMYKNPLNISEILPGALSHLSKETISRIALPPLDINFRANSNLSQYTTEFEGSIARLFFKWEISDLYRKQLSSLNKAYILSSGNSNVNRYLFYGTNIEEAYIQRGITSIDNYAFANSDLKVCSYQDGINLTSIGEHSFGSTQIGVIFIPNSVTNIGEYAYERNDFITQIIYSENMKEIPIGCFANCDTKEIQTASISGFSPDITSIGNFAFDGSVGLKLFHIPELQESEEDYNIEDYACYFVCSNKEDRKAIDYFTNLVEIGNYAFRGIPNINKIVINPSMRLIGRSAFFPANPSSFNKTIIEWSGTADSYYDLEIEQDAFFSREFCWKCPDIASDDNTKEYRILDKTIYIPSSVEMIGAHAFSPYLEEEDNYTAELSFVLTDTENKPGSWSELYAKNALRIVYNYKGSKVVKEETGAHLLYFLTNDKRAAIAKMLNSPAFVDIVSSVEFKSENYKLTEIIDEAFVGNDTNLNAINFDENSELEKIGAHVFSTQNLTKLQVGDTEKEIPTTVSYIGPNTSFKNTSWYKIKQLDDFVYLNDYCLGYSQKDIPLVSSSKTISDTTRVLYDYCFSSESIQNITLPSKLEEIGQYAFNSCGSLEKIDFKPCEETLSSIGKYAFANCSTLNSINYTKNIKYVGEKCTSNCGSLTQYSFDDGIELSVNSQPISPILNPITGLNNTITHLRIPASLGYFFDSSGSGYSDFMTLTNLKYLQLGGVKERVNLIALTEEEKEEIDSNGTIFESGKTYYTLDLSTIYGDNGKYSSNGVLVPIKIYTEYSYFDVPAEDYKSNINLSSITNYLYDDYDIVRIVMGFTPTGSSKITAKQDITTKILASKFNKLFGATRVSTITFIPNN